METGVKKTGMVSPTTTRVPGHTPEFMNRRILDHSLESSIAHAADPARINGRLAELDREWDIERVLEANASSLVIIGILLGYFVTPWLYWLSLLVGIFLLQHAIQGWCPPIRLFRRLGFRTHAEIATEYYALRALRGDFTELPTLEVAEPGLKGKQAFRIMSWPYMQEDEGN